MAKLDYPQFEVVVVDDGSAPAVRDVAERFETDLSIRYIYQENAGPARARNVGARHATGALVAFTDDDCTPQQGWLRSLERELARSPDALVGGTTLNAAADSLYSEVSQDLVSFLYENARRPGASFDFFTSNNMACRRDRFLALGGFDETFTRAAGEDRDFGLRMAGAGAPLIYAEDAVVDHQHRLTLASYWRQQRNYGAGAYTLHRRSREHGRPRVKFGGAGFYSAMLSFPFRHRKRRPLARTLLLALSQAAMATGYGWAALGGVDRREQGSGAGPRGKTQL